MSPVIIFILIAGVFIALAVWSSQQAKKRRLAMAAWAAGHQLSFTPDKNYSLEDDYGSFKCLRQGDGRYGYNICSGSLPQSRSDVVAFDYHYETHSTDSKGRRTTHHHYFSALILDTGLPMRELFIRPEGFFDKVTEFFGYDDIDFESAQFSRKFYVKCPEKKWAFDVIQQTTMEFLLAQPTFTLQFDGPLVIAYRAGTFEVDDFEAALTVIKGIIDRLPNYLRKEMGL